MLKITNFDVLWYGFFLVEELLGTMAESFNIYKAIIWLIKRVFLTILILTPLLAYLGTTYLTEINASLEKSPYVHWSGLDPHHEVYISWETEVKTDSIVKYGYSPDNLEFTKTDSAELQMHRLIIDGLLSNRKVYYQVSDSNDHYISEIQSFRTAPDSDGGEFTDFNATFIADTQQLWGTGHWNTIAKAINGYGDTDFLGIAGDVAQTEDDQATWNFFWKHAAKVTDTIPIITVPGNHDDISNPESLYFKYFGNTTYYPESANQWDTYYAFNWSHTQFVQMQIGNGDHTDPTANEQNLRAYAWLNETLERGMGQKYRVLMFHRQVFSTYENNDILIKYMVPIIEKYNVSLCLYGHQHEYERYYVNGHTYLLIAGGGGLQNANKRPQEITQASAMGAHFCRLEFSAAGIRVKVLSPTYDIIDDIFLEDHNGMLIPERITPYGGL